MKLKDLIAALAQEIANLEPQLNQQLDNLATLAQDDPELFAELELYSNQIKRMAEAAGVAGFVGLEAVTNHVFNNSMLIAALAVDEREAVIEFLRSWPKLMIHYLQNLDDPSVAAGLIDLLRRAPHPVDEHEAMRLMHNFGSMPFEIDSTTAKKEQQPSRQQQATAEDVTLVVPDDVDTRLMEGFLQEAPDQAQYLLQLVRNMCDGKSNEEEITAAKRAAHTLKGSSAIIGLSGITNISHNFEDILEYFESQQAQVPQQVSDTLLDAAYTLEQMVGYVSQADEYPQQSQQVLQNILDLANKIDNEEDLTGFSTADAQADEAAASPTTTAETSPVPTAAPSPASSPAAAAAPAPVQAPQQTLRINVDRIEELFRIAGEISVHSQAVDAKVKDLKEQSSQLLEQNMRLKKRLFELETLVDVRSLPILRAVGAENEEGFDPLEMEQYNELYSSVHALIEEGNDSILHAQQLSRDVLNLVGMQSRQQVLAGDLQHLTAGTRMSEVATIEPRLQRNIRNTAQATAKKAQLVLTGGSTLIDTDILNQLAEPLLHILRNAVDHGIETPEERQQLGKDTTGTIELAFSRQGQQVVLKCHDDGRGLDKQYILDKALAKGIVTAEQNLSDKDIYRLIFTPGFSTKEEVSQVSGRGVGMDVVIKWVQNMNGTIDVSSALGRGTTVEIRFAASMTTAHSLIVRCGGHYFALPSVQILQSVAQGDGEFLYINDQLQYKYEKTIIPARVLTSLVGLEKDPKRQQNEYHAVIVSILNKKYALAVDELLDSHDLLVKINNRYFQHMPGIAGASILGSGAIAVHLDLAALLGERQLVDAPQGTATSTSKQIVESYKVLAVDDSLSVRNTLQELLTDLGLENKTAIDGINAISVMEEFKPDLILTDLEMPNMNGIDLIAHVRARKDLSQVPIIMITSRSQDKHKEMAKRVGCNEYLTKPYNDQELISLINKYQNISENK